MAQSYSSCARLFIHDAPGRWASAAEAVLPGAPLAPGTLVGCEPGGDSSDIVANCNWDCDLGLLVGVREPSWEASEALVADSGDEAISESPSASG